MKSNAGTVELTENEEGVSNNVVKFEVLKGGGGTTTGNWLMDLEVGTKFSVQSKDIKNFMALDLEVMGKGTRTVLLDELASGQPLGGSGRVVASRFISLFDKVETLQSYEEAVPQQETEETTDGERDRTSPLE